MPRFNPCFYRTDVFIPCPEFSSNGLEIEHFN